ncbi:MarR family winged helix-turn-helix transcriptional regulator [Actinopolymorpha pittospori]
MSKVNVRRGRRMPSSTGESSTGEKPTLEVLEREVTLLVRGALRGLWDEGFGPAPGVDRHSYPMLVLLAEEGPMRVGEVARWFRLDKSTVSRHLARLATAELIEPVDERAGVRSPLRVSAAGRARLAEISRARQEWMGEAVDGWSPDDMAALADLMSRLNEDLRAVREKRRGGGSEGPIGDPIEGQSDSSREAVRLAVARVKHEPPRATEDTIR